MTTAAAKKPTGIKMPPTKTVPNSAEAEKGISQLLSSTGVERPAPKHEAPPAAAKGAIKHVSMNLDAELHTRAKVYCARSSRTLTDLLIEGLQIVLDKAKA